ncbi:hypothetical protein [Brevundimonas subvibrioides]|uniref:hypothetical protein n=1 Tax=Brevundimonas subvibrioides TaxID=74313 RepID=UPI0022B49407|nr:hypothetical protein [Brevundimonas subvibrioides]
MMRFLQADMQARSKNRARQPLSETCRSDGHHRLSRANRTRALAINGLFSLALVVGIAIQGPTSAQISAKAAPEFRTSDRLNVDVTTGLPFWTVPDVSIGPQGLGFTHSVSSEKASFLIPKDGYLQSWVAGSSGSDCAARPGIQQILVARWNQAGECFYLEQGSYKSYSMKGSYLESEPGGFVYTLSNGTRIHYFTHNGYYSPGGVSFVEEPDGTITTFYYQTGRAAPTPPRLRTVAKSNGFRLYYRYASDNPADASWSTVVGVTGYNAAYEACNPSQNCNFRFNWPSSNYVQTENGNFHTTAIIDDTGQSTEFIVDLSYQFGNYGRFNKVKLPTSDVPDIIYTYCPFGPGCTNMVYSGGGYPVSITSITDLVLTASQNGLTWNYGMSSEGPYHLGRNSTAPNGNKVMVRTTNAGEMVSLTTPDGSYTFDGTPAGHLTSGPLPDGTQAGYVRDARGNITRITRGSGVSAVVEQISVYPVDCSIRTTCNSPISVTDANGNQTVFQYDPVHGGVLKATGPTVNGVVRETRYTYEQRYPWYLNPAGVAVQDPHPIWVLASESTCRTGQPSGSGCAIPGDEVRTVYERGPASGLNNLLVRGIVQDATGLAARTCYAYDRFGNKISETGPNANLTSCP